MVISFESFRNLADRCINYLVYEVDGIDYRVQEVGFMYCRRNTLVKDFEAEWDRLATDGLVREDSLDERISRWPSFDEEHIEDINIYNYTSMARRIIKIPTFEVISGVDECKKILENADVFNNNGYENLLKIHVGGVFDRKMHPYIFHGS